MMLLLSELCCLFVSSLCFTRSSRVRAFAPTGTLPPAPPRLVATTFSRSTSRLAETARSGGASSSSSTPSSPPPAKNPPGSIVTIDCKMEPEGDYVPEPLFDTNGVLTFVLNGGNYLPGLHTLVANMNVGETVENVSLDAGWGDHNPELVVELQKSQVDSTVANKVQPGVELVMANGIKCTVTAVTDDSFTIDANPPLAGASYQATVQLLKVQDGPKANQLEYHADRKNDSSASSSSSSASSSSPYQVATFALGCFWGGECDFMRREGVVGTKVGYTQGHVEHPTYQQVCTGNTGHTEAIQVVYDPTVVSFQELAHVAMDRLGENKYLLNQVGNDKGTQYRHGIYYHTDAQKDVANEILASYGNDCVTECKPATVFYDAEDYHQQYLLKGGQSVRKNDSSAIRCYG